MDESKTRTEINELGEFGLIDRLTGTFGLTNPSTLRGIGDDAAVIEYLNKVTVVSTDLLVEGVHFDMVYTPLKHLGYKSVIVNLSDIFAMNAQPKQITVSIAISNRFSVESLEEIYAGIKIACERYGVDLVGGDTTTSLKGLVISVTAIGEAEKDKVVYRNSAKEGDLICVTGDLGAAYLGLQLLEREKQVFLETSGVQPELKGNDYILARFLKPEARKDIIEMFEHFKTIPHAMIDISDGLSSDLLHICTQSEVGCKIYEEKIPIDPSAYNTALSFNIDPTTCALNGGEDFELLFTMAPDDFEKIKESPDVTSIGYITKQEEGTKFISKSNIEHELLAQGWNSFKKSED